MSDLEKHVGADMASKLETSQGAEKHLEPIITPLETAILWPSDLKKGLSVNTCSDLGVSQQVIHINLCVASHLEKISIFADLETLENTFSGVRTGA